MSEVLIKLTGLWERRRGNLGKHVLDQPALAPRKILVLKNNRKERQPGLQRL